MGQRVATASVGAGDGGNLTVRASEQVIVTENRLDSSLGTAISTNSIAGIAGTGNAGNIEINTRSVLIEGGTAITSTSGIATTDRPCFLRPAGAEILPSMPPTL
jgi:large exoprotein involved in heme utilization and adhesion